MTFSEMHRKRILDKKKLEREKRKLEKLKKNESELNLQGEVVKKPRKLAELQ